MEDKFDKQYGIDPQAHILGQHRNIPETIDWSKLVERGTEKSDPNKPKSSLWGFATESNKGQQKG